MAPIEVLNVTLGIGTGKLVVNGAAPPKSMETATFVVSGVQVNSFTVLEVEGVFTKLEQPRTDGVIVAGRLLPVIVNLDDLL
jgi:hypothetical protein